MNETLEQIAERVWNESLLGRLHTGNGQPLVIFPREKLDFARRFLAEWIKQQKPVSFSEWKEQFEIFSKDYNRYVDGDPKMPFTLLRQSLASFIHECDLLYAFPITQDHAAQKGVIVPESLAKAMREYSGFEPSKSVLDREIDKWIASSSTQDQQNAAATQAPADQLDGTYKPAPAAAPDATPETDAVVSPYIGQDRVSAHEALDLLDKCRELERQRNALQAKLAQVEQDAEQYQKYANILRTFIEDVEWESELPLNVWAICQYWNNNDLIDAAIDSAMHKEDKP